MQLILASTSPYRRALLENFGLDFKCVSPKIDEEALKAAGPENLVELTRFLAGRKASSLVPDFPDAIIIGSDQIAESAGERLDKPGTTVKAIEQLEKLQGKTHRLITSLAVISPAKTIVTTEVTTIQMRSLSKEMIAAYVAKDNPIDCAGSYKIERAGLALVERMETSDPSAIQGLPLTHLTRSLESLGIQLNHLWRTT